MTAGKDNVFRLAHGVNPVAAPAGSPFRRVQEITFNTMTAARSFSEGEVHVDMVTAQYEEDRSVIPDVFRTTPDLDRSVLDAAPFRKKKKLPLLADILERLYHHTTADYLLFTNVDIALQPHFYAAVARIADAGHDAFVINRRTLPDTFGSVADIPLMYAHLGEDHKGYDCFVFHRRLYEAFDLGRVCVGTAWVGRALLANLALLAANFTELRSAHLTFHIGDDCSWRNDDFADYLEFNRREYFAAFERLAASRGPLSPDMRSYLCDTAERRVIPSFPSPLAGPA